MEINILKLNHEIKLTQTEQKNTSSGTDVEPDGLRTLTQLSYSEREQFSECIPLTCYSETSRKLEDSHVALDACAIFKKCFC